MAHTKLSVGVIYYCYCYVNVEGIVLEINFEIVVRFTLD